MFNKKIYSSIIDQPISKTLIGRMYAQKLIRLSAVKTLQNINPIPVSKLMGYEARHYVESYCGLR